MLYLKNQSRALRHWISSPFVLSLITPLVILDLWMEFYHRICFPLYGIPAVKRGQYIRIDRHKLRYLTLPQKIFCAYCGYGNGVITYWARIASETEKYWCGIQHEKSQDFVAPKHHQGFTEYGDEEGFRSKYVD